MLYPENNIDLMLSRLLMDRTTRHLQRAVKAQRNGVALSKGQELSPDVASLI